MRIDGLNEILIWKSGCIHLGDTLTDVDW